MMEEPSCQMGSRRHPGLSYSWRAGRHGDDVGSLDPRSHGWSRGGDGWEELGPGREVLREALALFALRPLRRPPWFRSALQRD